MDAYHTPPDGVYSSPVLPPGWLWGFSTAADDCYYIHEASNTTQWEYPCGADDQYFLQWLAGQLRMEEEPGMTGERGLGHGFGRPERPANSTHWWQKRFSDLAVGDFHYRPPPQAPRPTSSVKPGRPWHMIFSRDDGVVSTDLINPPPITPYVFGAPAQPYRPSQSAGYPSSMLSGASPQTQTSPHLSPQPQQTMLPPPIPALQYTPPTPPVTHQQYQAYSRPQQSYQSQPLSHSPSNGSNSSYSQSHASVTSRPSLSYSISTGSSCEPVTPVATYQQQPWVAMPNPDKYRLPHSPSLSNGHQW